MEDVYTIKVKTKPDTRNLYPSERRYSASTVSGLAWVHIALAATLFLLACLALINPESVNKQDNSTEKQIIEDNERHSNWTLDKNSVLPDDNKKNRYMLIVAPFLLTAFALGAGLASILASVRWYVDRNITWLFVMSVLSTLCSFVAFVLVVVWFGKTSYDGALSDFYKDKVPFKDFLVVKYSEGLRLNETHLIIAAEPKETKDEASYMFTKRVLSINILIAAFLEFLWSILSVKISYKGMRSNYKDDNDRRGNCVSVVTTIKGNNTKRFPNGRLLSPKPDLIDHYPNKNIKKIFLARGDNGFYLKNQSSNEKKENTDTSSEFYRDRVMNFLNRCPSVEGSVTDAPTSVNSEHLNTITEVVNVDMNPEVTPVEIKDRMTPVSWGDTPDHTIYNQDTINFDTLFKFGERLELDEKEDLKECSETVECNQ